MRWANVGSIVCLVTHPSNWFYLTGFTGESGALVVEKNRATLDNRWAVHGAGQGRGSGNSNRTSEGRIVRSAGRVATGEEACGAWASTHSQLTLAQWNAMRKAAGAKCRTIEAAGIPEGQRMRKDAQELAQMRKAASSGR